MATTHLFSAIAAGFALALSASAQSVELSSPVQPGAAVTPVTTPVQTGTKAVLYDNGVFVTGVGNGVGGADTSVIESPYCTYGFGCQATIPIRVADDFVVPTGSTWTLGNLHWFSYQTGAATTGTLTGINVNIWNGSPSGGGTIVASGPANSMIGSPTWTGCYRTTAAPGDTLRAIFDVESDMSWCPPLPAGTYYVDVGLTGTLASGPWAPPTTPANQQGPGTDNGEQLISGVWAPISDGCTLLAQDFPFKFDTAGGGPSTFCTSKTASLGCVPTLSAGVTSITKGAGGSVIAPAGPVPGGTSPGILFASKALTGAPVVTAYGELCLSGFFRGTTTLVTPGGTAGTCSGTYNWNLQTLVNNATAGQAAPGDTIYVQGWYRDTPNPGGANFTNALGGFSIL